MTPPTNHSTLIRELPSCLRHSRQKSSSKPLSRGQGKRPQPPTKSTTPSPLSTHPRPIRAMATLTNASRVCLRGMTKTWALTSAPVRALSTSATRQDSSASPSFSYGATFKGGDKGNRVPDFGHYMSEKSGTSNKLMGYFMVGGMGAISAAGAKSTVEGRWRDCDSIEGPVVGQRSN